MNNTTIYYKVHRINVKTVQFFRLQSLIHVINNVNVRDRSVVNDIL